MFRFKHTYKKNCKVENNYKIRGYYKYTYSKHNMYYEHNFQTTKIDLK